jgi:peptide/nickel transport system substrate-binding protein
VTARLPFPAGTLDPQTWSDGSAQVLASYAYDAPVALRDGKIVPQLASKWDVTPTSADLTIRDDVTCSDGSKLTAAEVADSINRMKSKESPAPNASAIFGSPDGFDAQADDAANTVSVKLDAPYGDLLYGLTQVNVICRAGLKNPDQLKRKTFGSGPWVLDSTVSGDRYTYRSRKGYKWGPGGESDSGDRPSKLVFKVLESDSTATNSFLGGTLDLTLVQGPDAARLDKSDRATTTKPVVSGAYSMYLNHAKDRPTANADVRRLLKAGLDIEGLATTTLGPDAEVPRTILNPNAQCYQPDVVGESIIQPSESAVQQYAEAAGYTLSDGKLMKDGKQLTLKVLVPDLFGPKVADFLISEWGKAGIKVDASVKPADQVVKTVSTPGGDWDVVTTGIDGDTPARLVGAFAAPPPPDGPNFSGVQNAAFLGLVDQAKVKLTADACDLWAAAEAELYKAADFIPWVVFKANWYGHDVDFSPWTLQGVYPETIRTQ